MRVDDACYRDFQLTHWSRHPAVGATRSRMLALRSASALPVSWLGCPAILSWSCQQQLRAPLGESKLTMKQNVLYLMQLVSLYWDKYSTLILLLLALLLALLVFASMLLL